jgi:hypothetical protein
MSTKYQDRRPSPWTSRKRDRIVAYGKEFPFEVGNHRDEARAKQEANQYAEEFLDTMQRQKGDVPLSPNEIRTGSFDQPVEPSAPRSLKPVPSGEPTNEWDNVINDLEGQTPVLPGDKGRRDRMLAVAKKRQAERQVEIESDRVLQSHEADPEILRARDFARSQLEQARLDPKTPPAKITALESLLRYAERGDSEPSGFWTMAKNLNVVGQLAPATSGISEDVAGKLAATNVYDFVQGGENRG